MEDKDLEMAMDAMKDEISGVKEYAEIIEYAKDPELKAIAENIIANEKQHTSILMQYITKGIQGMV